MTEAIHRPILIQTRFLILTIFAIVCKGGSAADRVAVAVEIGIFIGAVTDGGAPDELDEVSGTA